jgi:hypothetical protein
VSVDEDQPKIPNIVRGRNLQIDSFFEGEREYVPYVR